MADASIATPDVATNTTAATSPGAGKKAASQKKSKGSSVASRSKPTHPPTSEMVDSAIKSLKERGGSSLQAIKKYVAANYKVDAEKLSPFIKKYLKSAVASGALVQTKGKGASGSFKLAGSGKQPPSSEKVTKRPAAASKSTKAPKKVAKTTAKKPSAGKKSPKVKKAAATSVVPAAVADKKAAKPKTPSKAKKTTKVPTKKPKAPKPKKAKPSSKPAAARKTPKKK